MVINKYYAFSRHAVHHKGIWWTVSQNGWTIKNDPEIPEAFPKEVNDFRFSYQYAPLEWVRKGWAISNKVNPVVPNNLIKGVF